MALISAFWRRMSAAAAPALASLFLTYAVSISPLMTATLRALFNDVSLSPWTDFIDKVLALLALVEKAGLLSVEQVIDFESYLLRLVCRHLTAYDLVTFHHRGANYPDALLLDAVLTDYLARIERNPALATSIVSPGTEGMSVSVRLR